MGAGASVDENGVVDDLQVNNDGGAILSPADLVGAGTVSATEIAAPDVHEKSAAAIEQATNAVSKTGITIEEGGVSPAAAGIRFEASQSALGDGAIEDTVPVESWKDGAGGGGGASGTNTETAAQEEYAFASLPEDQRVEASRMFDDCKDLMSHEQRKVAAHEIEMNLANVSVEDLASGSAGLVVVGAALSAAAEMAPEVTAAIGIVLLGVAQHLPYVCIAAGVLGSIVVAFEGKKILICVNGSKLRALLIDN